MLTVKHIATVPLFGKEVPSEWVIPDFTDPSYFSPFDWVQAFDETGMNIDI